MLGRVRGVCWVVCGSCVCVCWGGCGVCIGRVWVLGRVCGVGVLVRVWGVCWGVWRFRGEKLSLAPLYYPDTLVNPDTCLGW